MSAEDRSQFLLELVDQGQLDRDLHEKLLRGWEAAQRDFAYLGPALATITVGQLDEVGDDDLVAMGLTDWEVVQLRDLAQASAEDAVSLFAHLGLTREEVLQARGEVHQLDDRGRLLAVLKGRVLTEHELVARTGWSRAKVQRRLKALLDSAEVARVLGGHGPTGRANAYVVVETVSS